MPYSSSTSSVRSASSCETLPSAAAPTSVRVLLWPVRPKGWVAIIGFLLLSDGLPPILARPKTRVVERRGHAAGRRDHVDPRAILVGKRHLERAEVVLQLL